MTGARPVIGIVGNDVPRQLVLAGGAIPHRLTGSWSGPIDPEARDLLGAADAVAARILTEVRAGRAQCDALVVCADSQAHVRLFSVLRATSPDLPLHLLDLPRSASAAARRFARFQLARLATFVSDVTGQVIDVPALASAARTERELGDALRRLRERRRAVPSRCLGSVALQAYLDASRLDPATAAARIDQAQSEVPAGAVRVHATGSNHPDAAAYRVLEEQGCTVVSEDHDTGDQAWLGVAVDGIDVDETIERLIDAHFDRIGAPPVASSAARAGLTRDEATASGAEVVAGLIRELDEAPAWDIPDQAALLGERGVALRLRTRVRPGDELQAAGDLAREITEGAASR
ncbi:2-hydroxyacyl-CoA dehydratase family protein [Microbacterium timonense]|uniref:2-hydroxyacyl-CoA dehydratase family protein n=1 Tax=Microbacterium timonense TaxID=2086576 RepID=UPI000D0FAA09|nr:2-hydroxyacyl-CoA dehydratase family protein [Microbacterium timonense]